MMRPADILLAVTLSGGWLQPAGDQLRARLAGELS